MSLENQISYEVIGAARDKTLCCPHIFFSLNYRFADSLRSSRSLLLRVLCVLIYQSQAK